MPRAGLESPARGLHHGAQSCTGNRFDDAVLALSDYVVPNESEAEALTGIAVGDLAAARRAATPCSPGAPVRR